jgi:transcriptional regulator with XRE-family HTH domain
MPRESPNPAFGQAVRELRRERGLTQEQVAFAAGVTPDNLSHIENATRDPLWTTAERIAESLELSIAQLAEEVEARG